MMRTLEASAALNLNGVRPAWSLSTGREAAVQLVVEFESEEVARQAYRELLAAGFSDEEVRIAHPYEGGAVVSVRAWGEALPVALEVLSRHEAHELPAPPPG
jgi:hypothetical protein